MSKYPLHDKLTAEHERAMIVGDFLDWLSEQGWFIGEYVLPPGWVEERAMPVTKQPDAIVGLFLDIDPRALEAEKRAMLEEVRAMNEAREKGGGEQPAKE